MFQGSNFKSGKQTTTKVCKTCQKEPRLIGRTIGINCINLLNKNKLKLKNKKEKQRSVLKNLKKKEKRENNTRLLKKKLDVVFSDYVRRKSADGTGMITCPCCNVKIHWTKAQNMHYNGRAKMSTRYDEINCYAGCMRCNVMLNGNYPAFTAYLLNAYGEKWLQELIAKGNQIRQWTAPELKELIKYYKEKLLTV